MPHIFAVIIASKNASFTLSPTCGGIGLDDHRSYIFPSDPKKQSPNSKYQVMWMGYRSLSISSELSTFCSSSLMTNEDSAAFVPHFIQQ